MARNPVFVKTFRNDVILLMSITALSAGIAFAANALRQEPLSLTYRTPAQCLTAQPTKQDAEAPASALHASTGEVPAISREIGVIALERLVSLKEAHEIFLLDVRPSLFYQIGHIPGAHSLQEKNFEADYACIKTLIETAVSQGKKIVVYCAGTHCPDASKVGQKLLQLGHGNLLIFEEGWEGWQQAELEEEQEKI
jgi:rhodanese-related sulfurtransferase